MVERIEKLRFELESLFEQIDLKKKDLYKALDEHKHSLIMSQACLHDTDKRDIEVKMSIDKSDLEKVDIQPESDEVSFDWVENNFLRMKNGMDQSDYQCTLSFENFAEGSKIDNPKLFWTGANSENVEHVLALSVDRHSITFSGVLNGAGDFVALLQFDLSHEGNVVTKDAMIRLTVNPDPKSLWTEVEPGENEIFRKAHTDYDYQETDAYKIFGASVRGRSHAHKGTFRDDDFSIRQIKESGWMVSTVADGAGSAKYSRKGSKIACNAVVEYIANAASEGQLSDLDDHFGKVYHQQDESKKADLNGLISNLIYNAAVEAYKSVLGISEERNESIKDYSTTLLFTISKVYEYGMVVMSFWVGDGVIAVIEDDSFEMLGEPDGGEFAGQTKFINMPSIFQVSEFSKRVRFKFYEKIPKYIFLATDGVTDPKFGSDDNLNDFTQWGEFMKELEGNCIAEDIPTEEREAKILEWMNFWSTGEHDDRTMVVLKRKD
ncbi:PP2C family serine/threonine-protein phosphatase [Aureibacter tunicatorum]|uniref:PP2C family serine/threonine-protein phosphatase n=1 Tax=Aureibacter tunicatorum TaxID=866807 RepID=UPI00286AA969|nr:PP2C family serine/threonine-protein phosphatase [Aureibacter tunicatorum]BDD05713.1 hypothetical protein AUTU_31960 [Aureibacter tunicatorum]